jgi:hypothetical protein
MSVFRCEICERSTNSDHQECHEWRGGLVCNDCWLGDDEIALWHKQQAAEAMHDALEKFVGWNKKYPSSRIYSEGQIRQIAAELDAIAAEARAALAAAQGEKPC